MADPRSPPTAADAEQPEATAAPGSHDRTRALSILGFLGLAAVCVGIVALTIVLAFFVSSSAGVVARSPANAAQAPDTEATQAMRSVQATATVRASLPLVLQDTFEGNENGWHTGLMDSSDLDLQRSIEDGVYRWEFDMEDGFVQTDRVEVGSVQDFYLTVDIRLAQESANTSAGVIFGVDYKGYYMFSISSGGGFSFWLNESGDWTPIIGWLDSEFIVPDGVNRLEVGAEDGQFTFFINGHRVAQIAETQRPMGGVGLVVEGYEVGESNVVEFDNFEVRAPATATP